MEKFITTKSVVGELVVVGDTIILPMADVSFGMGIGTFSKGETGSGGVGGKIVPSAVLVLRMVHLSLSVLRIRMDYQGLLIWYLMW